MTMRWSAIGLALAIAVMVPAPSRAQQGADQVDLKTPDGKTFGVVIFCNDCAKPKGKGPCDQGAENGWFQGKPCGQCLLKANPNVLVRYPYDLHVTGKLVDADGKPVKERFVKLFMPNGWGVRTRTLDDGTFRLMLGATADREGKTPITIDLGTRTDSKKGEDPYFAMFMLPQTYTACSAADAPAAAAAPAAKPKKK